MKTPIRGLDVHLPQTDYLRKFLWPSSNDMARKIHEQSNGGYVDMKVQPKIYSYAYRGAVVAAGIISALMVTYIMSTSDDLDKKVLESEHKQGSLQTIIYKGR